MVLVNGADGIGTGWSCSVPNYNPVDIIANLRCYLKGEEMTPMLPWYAGYKGSITPSREEGKIDTCGSIRMTGERTAEITELPVKKWTQDYREFIEEHLLSKKSDTMILEDYKEHHSEKTVHFEMFLTPEGAKAMSSKDLLTRFKLRSTITTSNMVLFDKDSKVKKYDRVQDIITDFAEVRLERYKRRKAFIEDKLNRECEVLNAKARFIELVLSKELVIKKRKIVDLVQDLVRRGFKPLGRGEREDSEDADAADADGDQEEDEEVEEDSAAAEDEVEDEGSHAAAASAARNRAQGVKNFEYLVGMPIASLTKEKVDELKKLREQKTKELRDIRKLSPQALWLRDLDTLEEALAERNAAIKRNDDLEAEKVRQGREKAKKKMLRAKTGSGGAAKRPAETGAGAAAKKTRARAAS